MDDTGVKNRGWLLLSLGIVGDAHAIHEGGRKKKKKKMLDLAQFFPPPLYTPVRQRPTPRAHHAPLERWPG